VRRAPSTRVSLFQVLETRVLVTRLVFQCKGRRAGSSASFIDPKVSHPVLSQNRMLIICVLRNQVYTHTVQKMDTE
jgi:hypothetical protein